MKLSVIIVNYNVRFFLEQAIRSAQKALAPIDGEIIVVDNASSDGSQEMMRNSFPGITCIDAGKNLGFSRANNLGIQASKGEYILLLNPDTVVAEDAFERCTNYLDDHADVGGLGVHMIDGTGEFLPESKRGLPTPVSAFYKIFGLSSLFPKSPRFGRYHLGYLDKEKTRDVEILSGAYMMMRRTSLDKAGMLDEHFFMYGEDIDLSYRLLKAGFRNVYFPEARIIHYKGESTKKGSVNYVFVFYRAMIIFARKHFEKGQASLFGLLINMAIYFRALLAIIASLFRNIWQMLIDLMLIYGTFLLTTQWYANYAQKDFDLPFISVALIGYALVVVIVLLYSNVYDPGFRFSRLFKGWVFAFLTLLGIYALLPEDYRFSRAVLLVGSVGALAGGLTWRGILQIMQPSWFGQGGMRSRRVLIIGDHNSLREVSDFLQDHKLTPAFSAGIMPDRQVHYPAGYLGHLGEVDAAIDDFGITEVIFDTNAISNKDMILTMECLRNKPVLFRMVVGNPLYIVGSQEAIDPKDRLSKGELMSVNVRSVKRAKRTVDLMMCAFLFPLSPVLAWFVDDRTGFFRNLVTVALGIHSWTGYDPRGLHRALPGLKPAVVHPMMNVIFPVQAGAQILDQNVRYLKFFNPWQEIGLVFRHFHAIGNRPYHL